MIRRRALRWLVVSTALVNLGTGSIELTPAQTISLLQSTLQGQPNGQPNAQPNVQPNVQANIQANVQPNVQSNAQPAGGQAQPINAAATNTQQQQAGANTNAMLNNVPLQNNVAVAGGGKVETIKVEKHKEVKHTTTTKWSSWTIFGLVIAGLAGLLIGYGSYMYYIRYRQIHRSVDTFSKTSRRHRTHSSKRADESLGLKSHMLPSPTTDVVNGRYGPASVGNSSLSSSSQRGRSVGMNDSIRNSPDVSEVVPPTTESVSGSRRHRSHRHHHGAESVASVEENGSVDSKHHHSRHRHHSESRSNASFKA